MVRPLAFLSGGHIGDCIYQLYTASVMSEMMGETVDFYVGLGQETEWCIRDMEALLDLIRAQPYIGACGYYDGQEVDHKFYGAKWRRLDHHESGKLWPSDADLRKVHFMSYMLKHQTYADCLRLYNSDKPWLTCGVDVEDEVDIVVHARWRRMVRDPHLWKQLIGMLKRIGYNVAVIVGPHDIKEWPESPNYRAIRTDTMFRVACLIKKAGVFLGTASSPYVIAEGLDVFRFIEVCKESAGTAPRNARGIQIQDWNNKRIVEEIKRVKGHA